MVFFLVRCDGFDVVIVPSGSVGGDPTGTPLSSLDALMEGREVSPGAGQRPLVAVIGPSVVGLYLDGAIVRRHVHRDGVGVSVLDGVSNGDASQRALIRLIEHIQTQCTLSEDPS
ncbi:MAG: hypothetical protein VX589_05220 [Myxococcota bacterium]|nr:hypothetical protein [Myxococcota bacterium]